jgi:hypothetical protein
MKDMGLLAFEVKEVSNGKDTIAVLEPFGVRVAMPNALSLSR